MILGFSMAVRIQVKDFTLQMEAARTCWYPTTTLYGITTQKTSI
jgi:hypothetical protein